MGHIISLAEINMSSKATQNWFTAFTFDMLGLQISFHAMEKRVRISST